MTFQIGFMSVHEWQLVKWSNTLLLCEVNKCVQDHMWGLWSRPDLIPFPASLFLCHPPANDNNNNSNMIVVLLSIRMCFLWNYNSYTIKCYLTCLIYDSYPNRVTLTQWWKYHPENTPTTGLREGTSPCSWFHKSRGNYMGKGPKIPSHQHLEAPEQSWPSPASVWWISFLSVPPKRVGY